MWCEGGWVRDRVRVRARVRARVVHIYPRWAAPTNQHCLSPSIWFEFTPNSTSAKTKLTKA